MNQEKIERYAALLVGVGVGLQPGQNLVIDCPLEAAPFGRACAAAAFQAGARDVALHYSDEAFDRLRAESACEQVLKEGLTWQTRRYLDYIEGARGATLRLTSAGPAAFLGVPPEKLAAAAAGKRASMAPVRAYTGKNEIQWCIAGVPGEEWAKAVFPALAAAEAKEALWQSICQVCRLQEDDPVAAWRRHTLENLAFRDRLNALCLTRLFLKDERGTDLVLGLAENAVWDGAEERTAAGTPFVPNLPTEEVFTAPHRADVNGTVVGSKPYVYNGSLIDGFTLTFEGGRVVRYTAEQGEALLGQLLAEAEGADRLGEFALVPNSSPVSSSGVLFYNTLFDENATCHMALGQSYASCQKDGARLSPEELLARGMNQSPVHADLMVGSSSLSVTGEMADGTRVALFEKGEWTRLLKEEQK